MLRPRLARAAACPRILIAALPGSPKSPTPAHPHPQTDERNRLLRRRVDQLQLAQRALAEHCDSYAPLRTSFLICVPR